MNKAKKLIAIMLAVVLMGLTLVPMASAESKVDPSEGFTQKIEAVFYMIVDKMINALVKAINRFSPGLDKKWVNYGDYEAPDSFYEGESTFSTEVTDGAQWSMGYAYGSLLEELDVLDGKYYMAGGLEIAKGKVPTEILDDQGVNVYALSDGVSGITVQAVIDGFGIARKDVLKIREKLASFAKENNIISINVSVIHQHSLIDTLGMGLPLLPAIITNPGVLAVGADEDNLIGGKNKQFMENLYTVVTQSVMTAVENMTEGQLYYGCADASDLMYDKRQPIEFDGNIHRLRFDPYDERKNEIWVCQAGIHCTGYSGDSTAISADFPYYFKEYVKNTTGADVVYVQGAEVAITTERDNLKYENTGKNSRVKAYGVELAKRAAAITDETALEPVMNIKTTEVAIDADNQILILAVRLGAVDSMVAKDGFDYKLITELGYMELGNKVGILLAPGEIAPEILWGGAVSKDESWTKQGWDYAPMKETAKVDTLICFGLNNDQVGYIMPDNDIRAMLTENEEFNVVSSKVGSTLTVAFEELIGAVK